MKPKSIKHFLSWFEKQKKAGKKVYTTCLMDQDYPAIETADEEFVHDEEGHYWEMCEVFIDQDFTAVKQS